MAAEWLFLRLCRCRSGDAALEQSHELRRARVDHRLRAFRFAPGRRDHQEWPRHQLLLGHLEGVWQYPTEPSAWCAQAFGVHRGSCQSLSGWLKLGGCGGVPPLAEGCEPSRNKSRLGPRGFHPHAFSRAGLRAPLAPTTGAADGVEGKPTRP